jgi:hypothetical protein
VVGGEVVGEEEGKGVAGVVGEGEVDVGRGEGEELGGRRGRASAKREGRGKEDEKGKKEMRRASAKSRRVLA